MAGRGDTHAASLGDGAPHGLGDRRLGLRMLYALRGAALLAGPVDPTVAQRGAAGAAASSFAAQ